MSDSFLSSPARIAVLPEVVQNQIAAGEVIERPASVVKELVENAIDAGAQTITVEMEEGGRQLVRVTDDGCGMSERDLILSIERHATSKIRLAEDIFAIATMGFRGEALPSIGAVSRMQITTGEADAGHQLVIEGGHVKRVTPAPPRRGTIVEIRTLFFNTPARLKFLKQPGAEVAATNEWLTRIALAHPTIAFRVENNGKRGLDIPAHDSLAVRIGALFGRALAERLLPVSYANEALAVDGFVAAPPESRNNSRGIYTFLNKRWIRHRGLVRVVTDAYQGSLPPRRFPFAVLNLAVDTAKVDVNVHPTKEEVRFEDDRRIVGSTRRAVVEALRGVQRAAAHTAGESRFRIPAPTSASSADAPPDAVHDSAVLLEPPTSASSHAPNDAEVARRQMLYTQPADTLSSPAPGVSVPVEASPSTPAPPAAPPSQSRQPTLALNTGSRHRVIGQAGDRYLIVEGANGIRIIDQHALHERWNYERLRDREHPMNSQRMLLPAVVELSPAEAAGFETVLPLMRELGFEVETFGATTLSISAAPTIVKPGQVERVVRDMFADVEGAANPVEELRDTLAKSLACRASVLFGKGLPEAALLALIEQFEQAEQPLTCPHGRPTSLELTWTELERRFERT